VRRYRNGLAASQCRFLDKEYQVKVPTLKMEELLQFLNIAKPTFGAFQVELEVSVANNDCWQDRYSLRIKMQTLGYLSDF
jgi:hypothetical protein